MQFYYILALGSICENAEILIGGYNLYVISPIDFIYPYR